MNKIHTIISRRDQACYTELNDEIVILNPDDENLYHFNSTATELWQSLDTPKTILQLCEIFMQKYHGTLEDYLSDVFEWVKDTQEKSLLTVMDDNDVRANT